MVGVLGVWVTIGPGGLAVPLYRHGPGGLVARLYHYGPGGLAVRLYHHGHHVPRRLYVFSTLHLCAQYTLPNFVCATSISIQLYYY